MTVLEESAVIPTRNLINPSPNFFTHSVIDDQPFWFEQRDSMHASAGTLNAGTKVTLLRYDGDLFCYVAVGNGLYVVTAFAGLKAI
jgi:hypothetical protein